MKNALAYYDLTSQLMYIATFLANFRLGWCLSVTNVPAYSADESGVVKNFITPM